MSKQNTLIDKLEKEIERLLELKAKEKPHSLGYVFQVITLPRLLMRLILLSNMKKKVRCKMKVKFYVSVGIGEGQEEIVELPDDVIV